MLDSVRIPLKVLNAAQLAGIAAAAFALACLAAGLAVPDRIDPDAGGRRVLEASRSFAEAVDEALTGAVTDARNVALLLRPDDPDLTEAARADLVRDWLALNPRYRDAVLIGLDGTVRTAGEPRRLGTSVAREPWFARARNAVAVVAGPEADAAFTVALALGPPGRSDRLQLRAAPVLFEEIGARVRRALALPADLVFTVTGADGRALAGSLPPTDDPRPHAATPTRGGQDLANPGWLVTGYGPVAERTGSAPDGRVLGLGLALVLAAGALGWMLGGRAARPLARLADAPAGSEAPVSAVREIAALTGSLHDRARSADTRLARADTGLDRVRGRLHIFETMSGWTCWEIDPETRQVIWSDREEAGTPADRAADLTDLAARFEPADHALLDLTLRAALAADGPHDAVLRTRPDADGGGARVLVRFLRGTDAAGRARVHALSRALDTAADTPAGLNERRRSHVLRRVTDGIVHDFNDVLTVVLANLGVLRRRPGLDPELARLADTALAGAQRGAALTRRMLSLARGAEEGIGESDLAATVAAFLPFMQGNVLRDAPVIDRVPANLPRVLCPERILEIALLNVAFHVRDHGLHGFAVGAAEQLVGVETADDATAGAAKEPLEGPAGPGLPEGTYVHVLLASGRRQPGEPARAVGMDGIETAARLIAEAGGVWRLLSDGSEEGFLAEIWLRAAERTAPAEPAAWASALRVLLVESDSLVRASVAEALAELGHRVTQAASGEHALALLAESDAYDAMIADQSMPVMTGLQLAAAVVERHPGIRVILASPHGHLPAAGRRFLQLDKPFRQEDLMALLGPPEARAA
ncbi:response regulator [Methylobacterium radiodurans]|uniref:histidine kinase n=1 Tax=Methylobacterium radiodurans TaxID=2202828 RepID=A0A2U8VLU3_9HYPH|nr:response regulator [Methylobacterium radiodurans]AWN34411.1 response regulator [Methylobacterium radiodurans]